MLKPERKDEALARSAWYGRHTSSGSDQVLWPPLPRPSAVSLALVEWTAYTGGGHSKWQAFAWDVKDAWRWQKDMGSGPQRAPDGYIANEKKARRRAMELEMRTGPRLRRLRAWAAMGAIEANEANELCARRFDAEATVTGGADWLFVIVTWMA
ncbi:hypothetical protein TARUN_10402 [Trichoderma arundinaceum]|uniref:Uncharacterized protein n=1 Tax=Trichoderma arundinaceum TaxID=490622 RepID=A0A395N6X1_TRIAR|nr:hypothetical protein TARUN_10402 [Trichoderma arundinaceum]